MPFSKWQQATATLNYDELSVKDYGGKKKMHAGIKLQQGIKDEMEDVKEPSSCQALC